MDGHRQETGHKFRIPIHRWNDLLDVRKLQALMEEQLIGFPGQVQGEHDAGRCMIRVLQDGRDDDDGFVVVAHEPGKLPERLLFFLEAVRRSMIFG